MNKKIFILHGWAYDTKNWEPFLAELKKKNISPVLLKIPGLTDKIDRPWDIDDYVDWLSSKLRNEKNIILIGHSNGGKIALSYALKYSNKISKLFLMDASGIYHKDLLLVIKRIVFKTLAKIGGSFTSSPFLRKMLYKFTGERDYYLSNQIMKKTMQNLINVNLTPELKKVKIPTVIIWGENDTTTPISDAHIFNKEIKNSKLFVIKNARHSPQFTHVEEVVKIIYEHI